MAQHKNRQRKRFIQNAVRAVSLLRFVIIAAVVPVVLVTCFHEKTASPFIFFLLFGSFGSLIISVFSPSGLFWKREKLHLFVAVYCFNIIFSCLLLSYYQQVYGTPYEYGGTDDKAFEEKAFAVLESPANNLQEMRREIATAGTGSWHKSENYVFWVAAIHWLARNLNLEAHSLNPRFLNALFLSWISVLVWSLARFISQDFRVARFAGFLCGLFPHMVFESAHIYRETLFSLGIIAIVWLVFSFLVRKEAGFNKHVWLRKIVRFALLIVCVIIVSGLRNGFFAVSIGIITLMAISTVQARVVRICVFGLAATFVGILLFVESTSYQLDGNLRLQQLHIKYYQSYTQRYAYGMGDSGIGAHIFRAPTIISIPLRLVYGSLNPLPFPHQLLSENYHRLGTLVWFLLLPFLIGGVWHLFRSEIGQRAIGIRCVAAVFVLLYVGVNLLTMQSRQATLYIPLACVLIACQMKITRIPVSEQIALMVLSGLCMSTAYCVLKGYFV